MTTEKFHKMLCRGVCSYMVLHVALMYVIQFGFLDYFGINVLQTLYMLAFLFLFIAAVASKKVELRFHMADVMLLLLAIWGILSTCFAVDKDIALYGAETRNEGLFAWFAYYICFYCVTQLSKKEKKACISTFSVCGFLMLLTGLICSYTGVGITLSNRVMAFAPLLHHNMYAGFGVLYLGVHMGRTFFEQDKKRRLYAALASIIAIAAIICSTSTLGYISAVFMLLVVIAMCVLFDRDKGGIFWKRVLMCSFILVAAAAVLVPVINETNGQILSEDVQSNSQMIEEEGVVNGALNGRLDHWLAGIRALPDYGLFGVGIDNYKKILKDYNGYGRYKVSTAHNEYIQLALTEGVPALVFYLCLLFIVFFAGIRQWRDAKESGDWLNRALFIAFMGYICQAFVNFSSVAVAPFFWIIMGMIITGRKEGCQEKMLDK